MATHDGDAIHQQVNEAWQRALPGADPKAGFFDQGATSMAAIVLILELEQRLGVQVPFDLLLEPGGTDDVVTWIRSNA